MNSRNQVFLNNGVILVVLRAVARALNTSELLDAIYSLLWTRSYAERVGKSA